MNGLIQNGLIFVAGTIVGGIGMAFLCKKQEREAAENAMLKCNKKVHDAAKAFRKVKDEVDRNMKETEKNIKETENHQKEIEKLLN